MSIILRISLLIGILVYVFFILRMLKKEKLTLKYSLLWFFTAFVLLIFDIFPQVLSFVSSIIGIKAPANTIFLILIFFLLILMISLSSIVSIQHQKIKTLIQNVSILQKEVEELKKK